MFPLSPGGEDEQARHAPGMAANVRGTFAPAHGEGVRRPRLTPKAEPPLPTLSPPGRGIPRDPTECRYSLVDIALAFEEVGLTAGIAFGRRRRFGLAVARRRRRRGGPDPRRRGPERAQPVLGVDAG